MRAYWLFPVFGFLSTPCYAENAPMTLVHEFHIHEAGGFLIKTLKELGTPEAVAIVSAACAAYGINCSKEAAEGGLASSYLSKKSTSIGENYYITGTFIKPHVGEEWWGIFNLEGYEVCKATVISSDFKGGGSTFNAVVERGQYLGGQYLGLLFYAEVPRNRKEPHSVDVVFSIYYVAEGTAAQYNCTEDGKPAWFLKG